MSLGEFSVVCWRAWMHTCVYVCVCGFKEMRHSRRLRPETGRVLLSSLHYLAHRGVHEWLLTPANTGDCRARVYECVDFCTELKRRCCSIGVFICHHLWRAKTGLNSLKLTFKAQVTSLLPLWCCSQFLHIWRKNKQVRIKLDVAGWGQRWSFLVKPLRDLWIYTLVNVIWYVCAFFFLFKCPHKNTKIGWGWSNVEIGIWKFGKKYFF